MMDAIPSLVRDPPSQAVLSSAPGKVILFGEHAVVYGKAAVAASLGLRTYAWIKRVPVSGLSLSLPDLQSKPFTMPLDQLELLASKYYAEARWNTASSLTADVESELRAAIGPQQQAATAQAVLAFLHLYLSIYNIMLPSLVVCVRSQLPVGAGLGSSASYSVALAAGLLALDDRDLDLRVVNEWAFMAEKVMHGNPSGLDNSIATYGGAQLFAQRKLEPIPGFSSIRFLLTNTLVPKDTKRQVEGVRLRKLRFPSVMDPLIESCQGISDECKQLFHDVEQKTIGNAEMYDVMETLIDMNHGVMAACGVSHPSLEMVRQITALYGLRSKLTGAGGGGCALTLLRNETESEKVELVKALLHQEGFQCYETEVGCGGVITRHLSHNDNWDEFCSALPIESVLRRIGEH